MIYSIGDDIRRIQLNRKLFSYKTTSHSGKYVSKTKGILTNYQKPLRSIVIFDKNKLNQVKRLCNELQIQVTFYSISEIT